MLKLFQMLLIYMYKKELRKDGEKFFRENLAKIFPDNKIIYIV